MFASSRPNYANGPRCSDGKSEREGERERSGSGTVTPWRKVRREKEEGRIAPFLLKVQEQTEGRRLNGFLGLSLNDGTILFLAILLDETVSVG